MELNNEFEVDRPIEVAWALLTDVERIAPCLPGAQLEEIEGDEYRGSVKVKVGPITANYKGKASFIEKDDANHRAVLRAEGRDVRQGNANATITATLVASGGGTKVTVNTDLAITGKVAQFGRGVIDEVSERLMNQFVQNLEAKVLSQHDEAAEPVEAATQPAAAGATDPANGTAPAAPTVRTITPTAPVEPVDLLGATGAPLLKRLAPVVLGVLMLLLLGRRLRRRRG